MSGPPADSVTVKRLARKLSSSSDLLAGLLPFWSLRAHGRAAHATAHVRMGRTGARSQRAGAATWVLEAWPRRKKRPGLPLFVTQPDAFSSQSSDPTPINLPPLGLSPTSPCDFCEWYRMAFQANAAWPINSAQGGRMRSQEYMAQLASERVYSAAIVVLPCLRLRTDILALANERMQSESCAWPSAHEARGCAAPRLANRFFDRPAPATRLSLTTTRSCRKTRYPHAHARRGSAAPSRPCCGRRDAPSSCRTA